MEKETILLSGPSLKNDTIFYGAATLVERFISFLIIPLLTKTLSQELYGVWTQIIVTSGLLLQIVLVGFHTAAVRFLSGAKNKQELSGIFHRMLAVVLLNSLIIIVFAFLFTPSLSKIMFASLRFSKFIPLSGFFLVGEALFELVSGFLRARKEIRLLSIYYLLKNAGRIVILAIAILVFHLNLFWAIALIVAFQLFLTIFIYAKKILRKIGLVSFSLQNIRWKKIILFSLPLVPYGFLIWGNNFVDRYFILHILSINDVSIYAVAYSLAAIGGIFYSILGFTLYPHLAKLWNDGDKIAAAEILRKVIKYYLFFVLPFIAVLTILSSPIIKIVSTAAYISNWQIIFWLSVGIGIFGFYQLNAYSILLANRTLLNLGVSAVAVVANVIFNILLIPSMGILGAAIARFISNAVLAFWITKVGKKYLPYSFPLSTAVKMVLATVVISLFLVIVKYYISLDNCWRLIIAIVLAIVIYGSIDLLGKKSILLQLKKNLAPSPPSSPLGERKLGEGEL